ncbi:MAG: 50S ribosomal protein L23 [Patescibacteria group bacterium]
MGLFSRKKDKDNKKADEKTAEVSDGKKDEREVKEESMKELYRDEKKDKESRVGKEKADKKGEEEKRAKKYGNAHRILVKPLVTEKASSLGTDNKYVFQVNQKANKIEIAKAINEVYGVKPISVNVVNMKGKKTRYGKTQGRRKNWKKAIVKLPKGKSIKIYEGV